MQIILKDVFWMLFGGLALSRSPPRRRRSRTRCPRGAPPWLPEPQQLQETTDFAGFSMFSLGFPTVVHIVSTDFYCFQAFWMVFHRGAMAASSSSPGSYMSTRRWP